LQELRTSEFEVDADNDPNGTGVRHLRVEVQRDKLASVSRRGVGSRTRK
jgi:hypothetical protein